MLFDKVTVYVDKNVIKRDEMILLLKNNGATLIDEENILTQSHFRVFESSEVEMVRRKKKKFLIDKKKTTIQSY